MEVVASLSQGRTAAAQCGLFTHKSVPVIFEPPCIYIYTHIHIYIIYIQGGSNMTWTDSACLHTNQSWSYLNHPVFYHITALLAV